MDCVSIDTDREDQGFRSKVSFEQRVLFSGSSALTNVYSLTRLLTVLRSAFQIAK